MQFGGVQHIESGKTNYLQLRAIWYWHTYMNAKNLSGKWLNIFSLSSVQYEENGFSSTEMFWE